PLERNLMGNIGRAADVTTALLVNNNQFAAEGAIDPQGEAWQELTERLKASGAEAEDGLYVRLVDTQRDNVTFEQRQARHTALEKVIEKLGKEAGFARVHTSHHYGSGRRNWHNTIEEAQRKVKEDFADGLPLVENEELR